MRLRLYSKLDRNRNSGHTVIPFFRQLATDYLMYEFIRALPVGPIPIVATLLSFYTVGKLLFYPPRRWRASIGTKLTAIYGCAMFGGLVWLYAFSIARQVFGFQVSRSIAYLIGTVFVMAIAELLDRLVETRRGYAPIREVTWKRFQQSPRDTMKLAAIVGIVFSIAFVLAVWNLPEQTIPGDQRLERYAFFLGNADYIYGIGWLFMGMGGFFHLSFLTGMRLLGLSRGKNNG